MAVNPHKPSSIHPVGLLALALAVACPCGTATARIVYAQTGSETSTGNGGSASDSDSFAQLFDDVTLASAATIRSVKWWGTYGFDKTPVAPFSFQLIICGDSGGLPDPTNVLGSTTVGFATLSPPIEIFPASSSIFTDTNYYEFRANITPTLIPAGTKVWFSVFANTANDSDDSFLWRLDDLGNSASLNNNTGVVSESINSRPLFVLYDTPLRTVTAIHADNFDAAGGLDGSPPDMRPGTETWTAATAWQADGTTASVNSDSADDSAFLPFTPLAGKIYPLSATLKQPTGGYSNSNTNAWAGIGFAESNSTGAFAASPNNPSPWMHVRRTGATRTVAGPGNTGTLNEDTYTGRRVLNIVFDTTTLNWTAEWFMGLRSLRKHTFTTHPVITHIGIAREDGVAADFEAFSMMKPTIAPGLLAIVLAASVVAEPFYKESPLFTNAPPETKSVETIGNFGPVGIAIELHQPAFSMWVGDIAPKDPKVDIEPGSPAEAAGLKKGQVIDSINGQKLKDIDPRIQLGQILADAEAGDGVLKFMVRENATATDDKEVIDKIPVLGAYSKTWPLDCPKSDKIVRNFNDCLAKPGSNKGFAGGGMLMLVANGTDKDLAVVRGWVHSMAHHECHPQRSPPPWWQWEQMAGGGNKSGPTDPPHRITH